MTLKTGNLQFADSLGGLANYENDAFNFAVNGHNLSAGGVSLWTTTWPINNSNTVSSIQLNYSGLETVWRYTSGALNLAFGGGTYNVETLTYYLAGNLHVETYVINQTGGTLAIPAFSVNVHVSLFNAPF